MVVLIAKNTVKEGLQEKFLEIAKEMIARTREEAVSGNPYNFSFVERKQAVSAMIWQATKTIRRCSTLLKNIRMKRRWNFIGQPSISKP